MQDENGGVSKAQGVGKFDISYGKAVLQWVGYTGKVNSYAAEQMEMRDDFVGNSVR